jgi:pimeloyl-ACP methyl ester carboxylesterase
MPAITASQPREIQGLRRSFATAGGVDVHVTEAADPSGPAVMVHGLPQHHYVYRDFPADQPPGLRVIAPDPPGNEWPPSLGGTATARMPLVDRFRGF